VSGSWDGDGAQCITGGDGTCTVSSAKISTRTAEVTFTVSDVEGLLTYAPELNTDVEGDSNGTSIVVHQP
jgi:hypothetical protein